MSVIDSLSPIERKILPFLEHPFKKIIELSGLDETSVYRALTFLQNKELLTIETSKKIIVDVGINGVQYRKTHLPERTLILALEKTNRIPLKTLADHVKLSDNELKSAIGTLKRKSLITIENEKVILIGKKEELAHKFPEEDLLHKLPIEKDKLTTEQKYTLEALEKRKDLVELIEKKEIHIKLTEKARALTSHSPKYQELLEHVTPEMIKEGVKKKFRQYDIIAPVPRISGGKKNIVQSEIDRAKRIWLDLGFKEMNGRMTDSAFWVFDALFTAQDHPVREMQDTFYLKKMHASLPDKKIVDQVKKAHEKGLAGSKGWDYVWSEEQAERVVLRTHTTSLSARTLAALQEKDMPAKYFAIGKAFRNETVDWSHGFEFFQTEGIVVDESVTFRDLLGLLELFYKKMGFSKLRFRPSFFPYTEPSVEIDVFHEQKGKWFELGGAGMFRPEVTAPLLGSTKQVLAWGQGLDRMIMDLYQIQDLRELYANDLKKSRNYPVVPR